MNFCLFKLVGKSLQGGDIAELFVRFCVVKASPMGCIFGRLACVLISELLSYDHQDNMKGQKRGI